MSFQSAFDPVRALSESWRILGRAPLVVLLGGIALSILTGGDDAQSLRAMLEDGGWDDFEPLLLVVGGVVGMAACLVGLARFLLACFAAVTFPRAVARIVTTGRGELSDLLDPAGLFLSMVVTQLVVGALFVAALLSLALPFGAVIALASAADAPALAAVLGSCLAVVALPVALYVYLGVRLAQPAVALEGLDPIAALKRSWSLVRGHRLALFVYLLVLTIFAWAGVLLCCVGVFVTGPMREVAIAESYLRLVRTGEEQEGWWLERPEGVGSGPEPPAPPPPPSGGEVTSPPPPPPE